MITKEDFIKQELKLSVEEFKSEYKEATCISIYQLETLLDKWQVTTLHNFGVIPNITE